MDQDGATPSAPATPAGLSPMADLPSDQQGPTPAEARSHRLRKQAKVAGFFLMLFGAFFAFVLAQGAYSNPTLPDQYKAVPGDNLTIEAAFAPNANVTLSYASGVPSTQGMLDAQGKGRFYATNATFTLVVQAQDGKAWTRSAFVPRGFPASLTLAATDPATSPRVVGLPSAAYTWVAAIAAVLVVASGYLAFKLRGPRLALGGAFVFLMGIGFLLASLGPSLLTLALLGIAVMCFAFIYRARAEFAPLRAQPGLPPAPPPGALP